MRSSRKAARLLFGGAGLLLIFPACSDDSGPAAGSAVSNSTTTSVLLSSGPAEVTTTVAGGAPPTVAPVDPAALLQQALAAVGGGYHFEQTVTVNGAVVATSDGDRLPDGARVAIHQPNIGDAFEIITPDGTWAQPEGGDWELLDSPPAAVDPIAALNTPKSVAVGSNDGTTVQLTVTVPLLSLGVPGDGDTPLQVTITSGSLTNIAYSAAQPDGSTASVAAAISPPQDTSPVVPPI